MMVEEQAQPDHPDRTHIGVVRQHEAHRRSDMRDHPQQRLALCQRFPDQPELIMLQISQAATDQLGRGGRGRACQITALAEHDLQASPSGIAGNPDAINAAADHEQIACRYMVQCRAVQRRLPEAVQGRTASRRE
jgi:hypothetical protein